jgi:endonuclease G
MPKRKRKNKFNFYDFKRLFIITAWCLFIIVLLFLIGRFFVMGRVKAHDSAEAAQYRNQLEKVVLPQGTCDTTIEYRGFTVHFNSRRHIPNCVVYELTASESEGNIPRYDSFERDSSVTGCANPWDYTRSGYDRGHMAPAGDLKWDALAMRESFKMTNVCPQSKRLNDGAWNRLEEKVREWARRDSALMVITGPVMSDNMKTIGEMHVAVPERFFKVILAPYAHPMRAIAFIYDNRPCGGSLKKFAVSVDEAERLTHIDFFSALPDDVEDRVESSTNIEIWLQPK